MKNRKVNYRVKVNLAYVEHRIEDDNELRCFSRNTSEYNVIVKPNNTLNNVLKKELDNIIEKYGGENIITIEFTS